MSFDPQQLRLRVEAKMDELRSKLKTYAADKRADANVERANTESKLREAETYVKNGWDKMTAEAQKKLNDWLR